MSVLQERDGEGALPIWLPCKKMIIIIKDKKTTILSSLKKNCYSPNKTKKKKNTKILKFQKKETHEKIISLIYTN